jgi:hypothetical protein
MARRHPSLPLRSAPILAAAIGAVALAAPATAAAAPNCEASALRGSLLDAPLAPATANGGAAACAADTAGLEVPLPVGVTVQALRAQTRPTAAGAHAEAEVADVAVGGLGLDGLLGDPFGEDGILQLDLGLLGAIPVDLRPALQDLLQPLDATQLLHVGAVQATADVSCVNGQPQFTGGSTIADLQLAGRDLPVNRPLTETIALVDTQHIDPSDIDLRKVVLPLGVDLAAVQGLLKPALDALPDIEVPPTLAHVQLLPEQHVVEGGKHTWRALEAKISLAGRSVVHLVLGEASVTATTADCAGGGPHDPPGPGPKDPGTDTNARGAGGSGQRPAVTDAALACSSRRIVLTDVVVSGRRVALEGVAHRSFAGKRVAIRLQATKQVVARPRVAADGSFRATAPLPPRSIRSTNLARYRASIGSERSLGLKLMRRMEIQRTTVAAGRVNITGRVIRPYRTAQRVTIQRRVSCAKWKTVKTVLPSRSGRFRATLPAPRSGQVAVYRLQTRVTWRSNPDRLTRTYTLPRYVQG